MSYGNKVTIIFYLIFRKIKFLEIKRNEENKTDNMLNSGKIYQLFIFTKKIKKI